MSGHRLASVCALADGLPAVLERSGNRSKALGTFVVAVLVLLVGCSDTPKVNAPAPGADSLTTFLGNVEHTGQREIGLEAQQRNAAEQRVRNAQKTSISK